MGVVEVNGIIVIAFHGCIDEEALVGGDFTRKKKQYCFY